MAKAPFVLIVEDDPSVGVVFRQALLSAGYDVRLVPSVMDAATIAHNRKPGLILMDVFLPIMDGGAAARALKADPGFRDIPVILVSGAKDLESRSRDAQAADFLAKPCAPSEVVERVRRLLPLDAQHPPVVAV